MYTDFDEMDIEPNAELAVAPRKSTPPINDDEIAKIDEKFDEELQSQLLLRTVPLDDGNIGYVFTCTKNGPLATWRCHVCNFVDSWKNLIKHMDSKWHHDSMSKFQHSRSNFSKVENAIPDISKGQPLPPGMEDIIAGPCQIWKTLESYDHPLIGLEFLLELNMMELKEPRYLCLLCDKRGDPRSILVHLTSQSHYLIYLRKYFKSFYGLIDKLPKSNECRGNVSTVTAHLIAKLEEKYGRLQPTATREDVINIPEQRTIILQKIDSGIHFVETPEDRYLEEMLTVEYVQNTSLLLKNFPLKPKLVDKSKTEENSKSMFHKTRGGLARKQLRHRNAPELDQDEPEGDVVFVSTKKPPKYDPRGRDLSPRSRSRSYRSSRSPPDYRRRHMSPSYYYRSGRHGSRSPRRRYSRSPHPHDRRRSRTPPYRSSHSSSSRYSHHHHRHTPERYYRRSPSPDIRSIYGPSYHGHSRGRSPPPPHHHYKRERSPHHKPPPKSRSPKSGPHGPNDVFKSSKPPVEKAVSNNNATDRSANNNLFGYQKELKEIQEKLNKEMEAHSETPENHPAYQDEWKKFWCSRFKELQAEGKIDPHTYDYKPEWITFWNVRVKELFNEELESQRKELKTKYGLKDDEIAEVSSKKEKEVTKVEEVKKPVVDIKTMWKELTGFEIKEAPAKQKTISPWEEDNDDEVGVKAASDAKADDKLNNVIDTDAQPISPEPLSSISDSESRSRSRGRSYSRSRSNSRSRSRSRSRKRSYSRDRELQLLKDEYQRKPSKKIHFENPLNIITVLRQLSVLEFQLGSYASHVITLLSSGLAMERVKPQSSVDLLTKENVIFLELVKEKMKGQLLAGVVQKSMVKATLFCIKNIEELLLLVPKMKNIPPPPVPAPPPGLLYGAGVETMAPAAPSIGYGHPPPPAGAHPHMYHGYGMPSAYKPPHGMKPYDSRYKPERYPFSKPNPTKKSDSVDSSRHTERVPFSSGKEEFPFADNAKDAKKENAPVIDEIPIDKMLIAKQIAEVLTAQGRTDVSEEELQSLINTVVENLKGNDANKDPQALAKSLETLFPKENIPQSGPPPAANVQFPPADNVVTIPAGFDLNDVPSSTLAILQDAYANVSSINASKTFAIEQLPESEIILLLRNFKSIPRFKQEKLIEYLRKLEDSNPERVEELKKYVNVL